MANKYIINVDSNLDSSTDFFYFYLQSYSYLKLVPMRIAASTKWIYELLAFHAYHSLSLRFDMLLSFDFLQFSMILGATCMKLLQCT